MSRNKKAQPIWHVNVIHPCGGHEIFMDEADAREFNADPDAGAAKHFGLTKIEYLQWIDTQGAPLCGHRTAGGDLCRNTTGGFQLEALEWKARHRKTYCAAHRPKAGSARK